MNFINELGNKYKNIVKELFIYYNKTYKYPLTNFINLPEIMQLGVIANFIIDKYNIGYYADKGGYMLFWYNPELEVNKLIKKYNETRNFNHIITMKSELKIVNYTDANKRAIISIFEYISNPF